MGFGITENIPFLLQTIPLYMTGGKKKKKKKVHKKIEFLCMKHARILFMNSISGMVFNLALIGSAPLLAM